MSYCSISDIQAVIAHDDLVQLTNDGGGDTVDTAKITDAASYASNVIDGYIRGRYSLPLATVPDELKFLAVDFVVYRLYSRRMPANVPAGIAEKYGNIIKTLELVQKGLFSFGADAPAFGNPGLKTNKDGSSSSLNRFYTEEKWDEYE